MLRAAPVVRALKPVMMMSPLSGAQFLSPGYIMFDLLVMGRGKPDSTRGCARSDCAVSANRGAGR
jgi:hypothetical protein